MDGTLHQFCETGKIDNARNKHREPAWFYVEVDRVNLYRYLKDEKEDSFNHPETYGRVLKSGPGLRPDQESMNEIEKMKRCLSRKWVQRDMTPLHLAVWNGKEGKAADMVQMLLNANADPNIKERFGHTAVELAASKGDLATMKVFQKKGLLKNLNNLKMIAQNNGHAELVKYLYDQPLYDWSKRFVNDVSDALMSPIQKAAFERFSATENVIRTTAGGKDELSMELYKSIGRQLGKNRNIVTVLNDLASMVEKEQKRLENEDSI